MDKYPLQLQRYFDYVRGLSPTDIPDYEYLRSLFQEIMDERGYQNDGEYDWSGDYEDIVKW